MLLDKLIQDFSASLQKERVSRWEQIDLAIVIHERFGSDGLLTLSQTLNFSAMTLQDFVAIGEAFPSAARAPFLVLSYSHFREAVFGSRLYTSGTNQSRPQWWLSEAVRQQWTAKRLRFMIRHSLTVPQTVMPSAAHAQRVNRSLQYVEEGQKDLDDIIARVTFFNQNFAPYFGESLELIRHSLATPPITGLVLDEAGNMVGIRHSLATPPVPPT